MAEMFMKPAGNNCQFGCYSERGLMSWFMFTYLPTHIPEFLKRFQFPEGCVSPFANLTGSPKAMIYGELDLGKQGFGCPDGAIYVECPDPTMLFMEVKLNETYEKSCRGQEYNSTIQGQLELKWRMCELYRRGYVVTHNNHDYVRETPEFKTLYTSGPNIDRFYEHPDRQGEDDIGSWRRLRITDGVEAFLDKLKQCEDRTYFAAITRDRHNPFDDVQDNLLPRCVERSWPQVKGQFCWAPVTALTVPYQPSLDWVYRFTANDTFPDPLEEIAALAAICEEEGSAYLLLNSHRSPPMSGARSEEVVGICTSNDDRLTLQATARVCEQPVLHEGTPPSVIGLYGQLTNRVFCKIDAVELAGAVPLDPLVFSLKIQRKFLSGQPTVKQVTKKQKTRRVRAVSDFDIATFDNIKVALGFSRDVYGVVIGLDPTAASWDSKLTEGKKKMPSFSIEIKDGSLQLLDGALRNHQSNEDFWKRANDLGVSLACIDGPCDTNGPRLLDDFSAWAPCNTHDQRDAEVALTREGVKLFWTTKNTVESEGFEGASRWIGRSLRLFSEATDFAKVETHPHGAFLYIWRAFGQEGGPPSKSTPAGQDARLAMLQKFLPTLSKEHVPNHDAMDAAVAALVAALHRLGLTRSYGSEASGGLIWMPKLEGRVAKE